MRRETSTALDAQLIAAQRAEMEVLRVKEERYRLAFDTSLDAIAICRVDDGMLVDVNRAFYDVLGYAREELVGQTSSHSFVWVDEHGNGENKQFVEVSGRSLSDLQIWKNPEDWEQLLGILRSGSVCRDFEARMRRKDGALIWGRISASLIQLEGVSCVLFATRDISAAKRAEEKIATLSHYDAVTGLPNRRFLLELLSDVLSEWPERKRFRALMVFDLDDFHLVNDAFGHRTGDLLLQETARRIFNYTRVGDVIARLSGDEFAVLIEELNDRQGDAAKQAQLIAQRILTAIGQPYVLEERDCRCTACVGITLIDDSKRSAEEIVRHADLAVSRAMSAGRGSMQFFEPSLQDAVSARVNLEEDLRQAIEREEFLLYYQPQVRGSRIVGAEALIRWNHPKRGLVPPNVFIPLAEETGLILPLGDWVLETACRQIAHWNQVPEMQGITLSVNISARQIHQASFAEKLLAILRYTGIAPHQLELELTETSLMNDIEGVIARMSALKKQGLRFSVDDFGTGYSSLSYLKRLPLDKLKIDRAFVQDILVEPASSAIAQAIISLCDAMKLAVVAEGVETEDQRKHLAYLGCHTIQGFLFSRPVCQQEFEQLFRRHACQETIPARPDGDLRKAVTDSLSSVQ